MEKPTCKRCGGNLAEINGGFYCPSCGANYAAENGELRLLECKNCGGNLVDCSDRYECELCGARYEKTAEKTKTAKEPEDRITEEEKKIALLEKFSSDYDRAFAAEKPEDVIAVAQSLESNAAEALELIDEIESEEIGMDAFWEVCAKFFGAMQFLKSKIYSDEPSRPYKMKEQTVDEMMKSLNSFTNNLKKFTEHTKSRNELEYICSCFLVEIYKNTGDEIYTKLVSERAAGMFTGGHEMYDFEKYCPDIAEVISFCEGKMETEQEELTAEYWEDHQEEFEGLNSEKALLEKERERLSTEEKRAVAAEKEKAQAAKKEYNDAEQKCYELSLQRSELKFFQKKKKEELYNESLRLVAKREELEKKMKNIGGQTEKNIEKIQSEYSKKDVALLEKIFDIERELERNHYPGEEQFVELFSAEMEKAEGKTRAEKSRRNTMELSYAYTEMEKRFLAMDEQDIVMRAASGAEYIFNSELPLEVKFSVLIFGAKAGTTQNGDLNDAEKKLIRYIFEQIWNGSDEELFDLIRGPAENGYMKDLINYIKGLRMDKNRFKRALSDLTLAFAFIDRKIEDEMRNKFNCWFLSPLVDELREEREENIQYARH